VRVHEVPSREAAQQLVRRKLAGTALVIPAGTDAALAAGRDAHLILYDDPVKYLERINIRTRMLELRDALAADRASRLTSDAAAQRQRAAAALADLRTRGAEVREEITTVWHDARDARLQVIEQARHEAARTREEAAAKIKEELQRTAADVHTQIERQTDALREELRIYVDSSLQTRADFDKWLGELRRLAGSRAGDIPAPPQFPELPDELQAILDGKRPLVELPPPPVAIELPPLRVPELPPLPELPVIEIPDLALPEAPAAPATLVIDEVNLTGGPSHINTFDQNVPGFAVTFLMLGMLLGISLGLLDEREWGTFERMRALPVGPAQFMLAKLLSRFLVGVGQMILLLAVGWLAFGVSLGPQPAALLLPTVGIAFAGTACGLIVAALRGAVRRCSRSAPW